MYLLVVVPPQKIIDYVEKYRKKYSKYTTYKISPHITIYPPFSSKLNTELELIQIFSKSFKGSTKAEIKLSSVDFFEGKNNVFYFKPDNKSSKYLLSLFVRAYRLRVKLKGAYNDYCFTPQKFKPHMTIAEKIPKDEFALIKKDFVGKKFDLRFKVSSLYLYKYSDKGRVWKKIAKIGF